MLGAWGKGRSSSSRLNAVPRSCLGWLLLSCIRLVLFWIPTLLNLADDPSRHLALREPRQVGGLAAELIKPESTDGHDSSKGRWSKNCLLLEVFAGQAGRSRTLGRRSFRKTRFAVCGRLLSLRPFCRPLLELVLYSALN